MQIAGAAWPPGHSEGGEPSTLERGKIAEKRIVGGIGSGPATLNVVDPQPVQLASNNLLVGHAEIDTLRLRAIAQRGVQQVNTSA